MDVLQLFWVIIYGYLFFWCAYLFVFAIGGVFYSKPKRSHISSQSNFAILVPAYKEDAIILSTVEENLKDEIKFRKMLKTEYMSPVYLDNMNFNNIEVM